MNDIGVIHLDNGGFTVVDSEMLPTLNQFKWRLHSFGYAYRPVNRKPLLLHRVINQTPEGFYTDHVNGFKLDNRKCNLRTCDNSKNQWNSKKRDGCFSKYKGVSRARSRGKLNGKWQAEIVHRINGKRHRESLGVFSTEAEAARAYDEAVVQLRGNFAKPNFP